MFTDRCNRKEKACKKEESVYGVRSIHRLGNITANSHHPPSYRDGRSHQGLAGGVVGSVLGFEVGNGNPLATGLGAAAGSLIGNEVSGRR
ncbi:glycine zipper 2TM domain-containing protein [Methyloglobulus sp.]|uniref:glycine zipper 2TM domain-containing protein n=1 Tax=Methyloglobulus sp. TaxID=2518622 RepID=UPI00398960A3